MGHKSADIEVGAVLPFDTLSPAELKAVHRETTSDVTRLGNAGVVYFVIGNYDRPQKRRVELVRNELQAAEECCEAFILEEVGADDGALRKFYLKFHLYLSRSDYVAGVFEDNDGGHELELGETPVEKTFVLKRDYPSKEIEHERFDGMLAKLFEGLEYRDRLFHWTDEDELRAAVLDLHEAAMADE